MIHFQNIQSGMEGNFEKMTQSYWVNQDIHYDIGSVMQYGGTGFSINGKATITYKGRFKLVFEVFENNLQKNKSQKIKIENKSQTYLH